MPRNYILGFRKYAETAEVLYWLVITAKAAAPEASQGSRIIRRIAFSQSYVNFIDSDYWKILIMITVVINTVIYISYFWLNLTSVYEVVGIVVLVIVHSTCVFYWIDFIGAVIERALNSKNASAKKRRTTGYLIMDAISLLPLSAIYMMSVKKINITLLWQLRAITLIRFYRIPRYFSQLSSGEKNHWNVLLAAYIIYLILFVIFFSNIFLYRVEQHSPIQISEWNETTVNKIVVSLYYSLTMVLNLGYGDILPMSYDQILLTAFATIVGTAASTGIFSGILGIAFMCKNTRRETYRYEYEATKITLQERNIEKKVISDILDNMDMLWKLKKGYYWPPPVYILPSSMQREIYFDINYQFLIRSLIFSTQPRSFLRSVAMFMRNVTYLPGDIILEPTGMSDVMICVASGVIEVLSEENDESVLFSLTTGTIIGEATMFIPLPIRCVVRASTYVELQTLMKVHFSRLALTYPGIYRSMREEIFYRLHFKEEHSYRRRHSTYNDPKARRQTKKFLASLKNIGQGSARDMFRSRLFFSDKEAILSLYSLSENIPRVKALPLTLIRARPWILRPGTTLIIFWKIFNILVICTVSILYPVMAGFVRNIDKWMYVALIFTRLVYVVDIYIQCTTAIERNDHFTYLTQVKEIIAYRLTTVGFYLDVISMYYLGIYSSVLWPENEEYVHLLFSLNALLKSWTFFYFMKKAEENMKNNLLILVTIKYAVLIGFLLTWGAVLLYIEARPGNDFEKTRWFYQMELDEPGREPVPRTVSHSAMSFYFATVTIFALGYGDIVAKSIADCVIVMICMISGFILIVMCVAESSAVMKHLVRIRTSFQEELFAVDRFMTEHDISPVYKQRVRIYMSMQWDYDKGHSLKQASIPQAVPSLQRRILRMELSKSFWFVPLFRHKDPGFLKLLAKLCKVRVLPPNEFIIIKGSFIREMYIVENGYCQITKETGETTQKKIVGPVTPFGYIEMILGGQQRLQVETLTHVRVVSLNYNSYLQATTKYPEVKLEIDESVRSQEEEEDITFNLSVSDIDFNVTEAQKIQMRIISKPFINLIKFNKTASISYWQPFRTWGKFRILQFFLMPVTIAPDSTFMTVWMMYRILKAVAIGFMAPLEFSLNTNDFMTAIIVLQTLNVVDIYFMFHVAYYDSRGLLMFHPAKTATQYLKGNFILDVIAVFPYYWTFQYFYQSTGPQFYINSSGLIMVLQLYIFFQGFSNLEKNILRKTDVLKILKLFPFVCLVVNVFTGTVLLLQCHKIRSTNVPELQGGTRLGNELVSSIFNYCASNGTEETSSSLSKATLYKMYIILLYWIITTITVCGFGDIWAHNETTMIVVILILTLGIFFFTYVFASITSNMVNTNVLISTHRRRILKMTSFMKKENVNPDLFQRMVLHYEYNWKRTEGQSPQKVLSLVHAALREKIVTSMYEGVLMQNPAFKNLTKAILTIIGKHLDELYFLQGETIIKYKDIQEHIYLIYRGEVHVVSQDKKFITLLGPGGMFGNIHNKLFSLSSESVVASENVDLIRLERRAFFTELQDLPNTKSLIEFLTTRKENYVIPSRPSGVFQEHNLKLNVFRIRRVPLERRGTQSSPLYLIGGFSLKNSVFYIFHKAATTFIILPGTKLHTSIEMCVFAMAYLSVTLNMYMFAFQDFSLRMLTIIYFLDLLFYIEMFLQLHMSDCDKYGDCIINTRILRQRYIKSNKLFYDIVTNFPLEVLTFVVPRNWWLQALSVFRLNRTLRLSYVFRFYFKKKKELMINKISLELGWIVLIVCLMIHSLSCVWFVGVAPLGKFHEPTWISDMDLLGREPWEYYIYSIFHIIVISTTTGLQKLKIYSLPEVIMTMIFMITCRYVVVIMSGLLAAAINADTTNLFTFQQKISELKETFRRQKISPYQLDKMWHYLTTLWLHEKGKQMPKFISLAPYTLKCEVMMEMFGTHLSESYIFSGTDLTFLRQLASHLKRFVFFPGNYIVQQGDIDYTMYFIHKGEVSVLTIHPELLETIHFTLTANDHFGIKQGLILGSAHIFSYRAETDVEILSLTLSDWQHLLKYFPEDAQKINEKMDTLPKDMV